MDWLFDQLCKINWYKNKFFSSELTIFGARGVRVDLGQWRAPKISNNDDDDNDDNDDDNDDNDDDNDDNDDDDDDDDDNEMMSTIMRMMMPITRLATSGLSSIEGKVEPTQKCLVAKCPWYI